MGRVVHPFGPVYDENSKILILGTMPSVASREQNFYYAHPANRFYKVLAALLDVPVPQTVEEKKQLFLSHGIAVFDVLRACDIHASADASIRKPVPNDFTPIFETANIRQVYANGKKACGLYERLCQQDTGRDCVCLPSTSAANARMGLDALVESWSVILETLWKTGV